MLIAISGVRTKSITGQKLETTLSEAFGFLARDGLWRDFFIKKRSAKRLPYTMPALAQARKQSKAND